MFSEGVKCLSLCVRQSCDWQDDLSSMKSRPPPGWVVRQTAGWKKLVWVCLNRDFVKHHFLPSFLSFFSFNSLFHVSYTSSSSSSSRSLFLLCTFCTVSFPHLSLSLSFTHLFFSPSLFLPSSLFVSADIWEIVSSICHCQLQVPFQKVVMCALLAPQPSSFPLFVLQIYAHSSKISLNHTHKIFILLLQIHSLSHAHAHTQHQSPSITGDRKTNSGSERL